VAETIEAIERRIDELRGSVRGAVLAGDKARTRTLRAELKRAEQAWEEALSEAAATSRNAAEDAAGSAASSASQTVPPPAENSRSLLPLREQVYEALSLLQVPAAPRLIATVHEAFFGAAFPTTRVTSLKRDEERSFKTAPFARPYYICAALSADYLSPSRGLLAVSTWPLAKRVIGPLSPRVDFLTAAIRIAEALERIPDPPSSAWGLLARFAASIPGASQGNPHSRGPHSRGHGHATADPAAVRGAAEAELAVHHDADARTRQDAADRGRKQLTDAEQFFGTKAFAPTAEADEAE
jgi:hypothetical protein